MRLTHIPKIFSLTVAALTIITGLQLKADHDEQPIPLLPKISTAPAIDGNIDQIWQAGDWYSIDQVFTGSVNGPDDLSAQWTGLYDDTCFYLLVDITDDALQSALGSAPHANDRIEIYFNMDNQKPGGGNARTGDNYQYAINYNHNVPGGTSGYSSGNASWAGVTWVATATSKGWLVEIKFPWSALGSSPQSFGFDIAINDKDDTTPHTVTCWHNTLYTLWGNIDDAGTVTKGDVFDGNYAPSIQDPGILDVNEGSTLQTTVTAIDSNTGDQLTFTASNLPSFASFTDNGDGTATISAAPQTNDANIYFADVTVSDGQRETASQLIFLVRDPQVSAQTPVIDAIEDTSVQQGELKTLAVTASDKDSFSLTISGQDLPAFVTLKDNGDKTATLSVNPTFEDAGQYTITVVASDGELETSESFTLTVTEPVVKLTEFFIDPENGSDDNDGSSENPWRSLAAVMSAGTLFEPGDHIYLRNGYHGEVTINASNSNTVYILAEHGHSPRLSRLVLSATASHWHIEGLEISRSFAPFYTAVDIVTISGEHNYLENCTVYSVKDTTGWSEADWTAKHANGIDLKGSQNTIYNNRIYNTRFAINVGSNNTALYNTIQYFSGDGFRLLGDNNLIEGNLIMDNIKMDDNHDDGIQSWSTGPGGVGTGVVYGNILRGNVIIESTDPDRPLQGPLQGIGLFDGMFEDWLVENNVICVSNFHGIAFYGATNCKIINNTVVDPEIVAGRSPRTWIGLFNHKNATASTGNTISNNIMTRASFGTASKTTNSIENNQTVQNLQTLQSYFVNFPLDLRLKPGSPAIDAGVPNEAPTNDIDGNPRPDAVSGTWDLGAYEFTEWHSTWFGSVYYPPIPEATVGGRQLWGYHAEHGWLYIAKEVPSQLRLWEAASQEWFWTSEAVYPWLYSYELDTWIWHDGE